MMCASFSKPSELRSHTCGRGSLGLVAKAYSEILKKRPRGPDLIIAYSELFKEIVHKESHRSLSPRLSVEISFMQR